MAAAAIELYEEGVIDNIILVRNAIPKGSSLGYFPGTEKEKVSIWLSPILDTFKKVLRTNTGNDGLFNYMLEKEIIQTKTLETLTGSSFDDTFLIAEDSQDMPLEVLIMLATRMGENSTICFNGDFKQKNSKLKKCDFEDFVNEIKSFDRKIKNYVECGYELDSWKLLPTPIVEFSKDDILRSGLTRKIVEIFD